MLKKKHFFNRPLRILLITNGFILIANAMLGPIYAIFVERIGGNLLDASMTVAIFALAAGIASLVSGRYSDKVKENELIVVWGYTLIGCGYLLYMFVDSVLFLFLVMAILGIGEAIYSPAFDSLYTKHIDHHKAGLEWGAWETMNYFIYGLGAAFGGILVSFFGFGLLFFIMMILSFGSALYIYWLPRKIL